MSVQTVTGPAEASELGFTYSHEHVIIRTPGLYTSHPYLWDGEKALNDAISALKVIAAKGVQTIVDMTPADFHRDPELIRKASEASGVKVIHATGIYVNTTFFFQNRPIEEIMPLLLHDIQIGMNGTNIKAGVLKAATGPNGVDRVNDKSLRAIARVHRQTGVPIGTHTDMSKHTGLEQQRVFKEEGVDLGRVYIGHSNDTKDVPYLEQVIENGSFVSMDRFGLDLAISEEDRVDLLVEMCKRGYADRILLSHDANSGADWLSPALETLPNWNWSCIVDRILPKARERGVTDAQIHTMMVDNPRRVFEQDKPY